MINWFTSDTHFGHKNIIKYTGRPFKSLEEMDYTLIRNWNERVKIGDTIYFLGDFIFKNSAGGKPGEGTSNKAIYYEKQLNGKIIFIKGNHDGRNGCKTILEKCYIRIGGNRICLTHKPEHADMNCKINLVGHIHQHYAFKRIPIYKGYTDFINVGVDVNNFRPVDYNEIMSKYCKWINRNHLRR